VKSTWPGVSTRLNTLAGSSVRYTRGALPVGRTPAAPTVLREVESDVLAIIIALFAATWFVQAVLVFLHISQTRDLFRIEPIAPARWPRVSVIIPARNEADWIETALESRLADDYPDLEIIVVDDRSTDETPAIIARIAPSDLRVRSLRVDELPEGWLGKVHALQAGMEVATGEWLQFSDADAVVRPRMLAKAVAHCESDGVDVLAVAPEFLSRSRFVRAIYPVTLCFMWMVARPRAARSQKSRLVIGSGAFNLVRRSAYDATLGFEHLHLETGDDMALASMVKQAGGRCEYMNGRRAVSVNMYDTMSDYFRGCEKNGSTLASAPFTVLVLFFLAFGVLEFSPLIALGVGIAAGIPWLAAFGAVMTLLTTGSTVAAIYANTGMLTPGLVWPIGWPLAAAGLLRSAWLFNRRGGASWRGTFYSREDVLKAQRIKLG
jgi:Glycosyl transferase family 2